MAAAASDAGVDFALHPLQQLELWTTTIRWIHSNCIWFRLGSRMCQPPNCAIKVCMACCLRSNTRKWTTSYEDLSRRRSTRQSRNRRSRLDDKRLDGVSGATLIPRMRGTLLHLTLDVTISDVVRHHTRHGTPPYQTWNVTIPDMERHHTRHGTSPYQTWDVTIPDMGRHHTRHGTSPYQIWDATIPDMGCHHTRHETSP